MAKAIPKQETKKEVTLNKSGLEKIVTFLKSQFPGIENILIIVDEGLKIEGTDIKLVASTLITEQLPAATTAAKFAAPMVTTPPKPAVPPQPATPATPAAPPTPPKPAQQVTALSSPEEKETGIEKEEDVPLNLDPNNPNTRKAPDKDRTIAGKGPIDPNVPRVYKLGRAAAERAKLQKLDKLQQSRETDARDVARDEVRQALLNIAQTLK